MSMFKLTQSAAAEIKRSATAGDSEELALRVAAARGADGGIDYRVGFDEIGTGDTLITSHGVDVVISAHDKVLLNGTVMDYVELGPGEHRFVFLNPNDPHYRAPSE